MVVASALIAIVGLMGAVYAIARKVVSQRFALCISAVLGVVSILLGYTQWKTLGELVADREYSPSGEFYVERFSVKFRTRLVSVAMPGNGSDNVEGFIRLRRSSDDEILEEKFVKGLMHQEVAWLDYGLWLLGSDITWATDG